MIGSSKTPRVIFALTTIIAMMVQPLVQANAPSGHEIIQRFVAISGGHEAYSKIQNRVTIANIDAPDHGMKGEFVEILTPPNYRRMLSLDIYDANITGISDGVPWSASGAGKPENLKGAAAADVIRHAQLNPFLDWTPESGTAELLGEATIEKDECYRVEITPNGSKPLLAFFSKKTGLLRRIDNWAATMFRHFDDYRILNGVLVPYALQVDAGMMWTYSLKIISIEQNVELDKFSTGQLFTMYTPDEAAEMLGLVSK